MPIGLVYWLILFLWLVLGIWWRWPDPTGPSPWRAVVPDLFPFVLFVILGWHAFGAAIQP